MELIYSLILGTMNWCGRSCFSSCLVFFLSGRGEVYVCQWWVGVRVGMNVCVCVCAPACMNVCVRMQECEIRHHKCSLVNFLIVLTQALKISLHAEAPWFSRMHAIQRSCQTSAYSCTTLLHPCVLMYLFEKGWPLYRNVTQLHISLYIHISVPMCAVYFYFYFFPSSISL